MMSQNKTPTVWTKLVDNIDVSDKGGLRVGYDSKGRTQYVYLNSEGLEGIVASARSLEQAKIQMSQNETKFAVKRKAQAAYNKAYKLMFDLTQDDTVAQKAGEAAQSQIEALLAAS